MASTFPTPELGVSQTWVVGGVGQSPGTVEYDSPTSQSMLPAMPWGDDDTDPNRTEDVPELPDRAAWTDDTVGTSPTAEAALICSVKATVLTAPLCWSRRLPEVDDRVVSEVLVTTTRLVLMPRMLATAEAMLCRCSGVG